MDMVKKCTKCNQVKPLDSFYIIQQRGRPYVRARCKSCEVSKSYKWNQDNRDRFLENHRRFSLSRRPIECQKARQWAKENPERLRETHRRYYEKNLYKIRAQARNWAKQNKARATASKTRRKLVQMSRVPAWANDNYMAEMYRVARIMTSVLGMKIHVDHIVPLQSKIVCGFHTHDNLQLLPARTNIRKRNIYWPDMP